MTEMSIHYTILMNAENNPSNILYTDNIMNQIAYQTLVQSNS